MVHFERWKIILVMLVCLWGLAYAAPNIKGMGNLTAALPGWMPHKSVSLGLDLQGGSHLLFEVDIHVVIRDRLDSLVDAARKELRSEKIGYLNIGTVQNGVTFQLRDANDLEKARKIARNLDDGLYVEVTDSTLVARYSDQAFQELKSQAIAQSIEIIRRRVDETGTREPIIQRQGDDRILVQLPGVDNPQRIKELIGTTAKMTFHLVDTETPISQALSGRVPAGSEVLPMAENPVQRQVIRKRAVLSGEMLVDAQPSFQEGQPVVAFRFDAIGGKRFCDITRKNVGRPFAIVLDRQIISAPVIRDAICGGRGIISGGFTVTEANDLALLLRAGALPAPLTVLEERTVGPSLGADSIEAGKKASLVGLAFVLVFMLLSYGLFGLMANIALFFNMTLIFAVLSVLQATLTLPGIAGIVLTIGMAVDANVLIFERIREETGLGRSPISAVDAGYNQAMSTIIDANVTTLIAAVLLYSFGTGPVKGFAVTLAIGIVTSMFSAIMLTRMIIVLWLRRTKPKTLRV